MRGLEAVGVSRSFVYDVIYALAASEGRERVLFGSSAPLAHEAFGRSLVGDVFPELWFEVPLLGEPWFDLHTLVSRKELDPGMEFSPAIAGGHPELLAWFAGQTEGRQLALSYDVGRGDIDNPAMQVLAWREPLHERFLELASGPEAAQAFRAFRERTPREWFACYTGVFPGRDSQAMHVECIVGNALQRAYAADASLLRKHLADAGLSGLDDTLVPRCQQLAQSPFPLEFQFELMPDGTTGGALGASVRFGTSEADKNPPLTVDGPGGEVMGLCEEWGLADSRWRELPKAAFAKGVSRGGLGAMLYCYPAFVKLRWRDGQPLDAKTYLQAGVWGEVTGSMGGVA